MFGMLLKMLKLCEMDVPGTRHSLADYNAWIAIGFFACLAGPCSLVTMLLGYHAPQLPCPIVTMHLTSTLLCEPCRPCLALYHGRGYHVP